MRWLATLPLWATGVLVGTIPASVFALLSVSGGDVEAIPHLMPPLAMMTVLCVATAVFARWTLRKTSPPKRKVVVIGYVGAVLTGVLVSVAPMFFISIY